MEDITLDGENYLVTALGEGALIHTHLDGGVTINEGAVLENGRSNQHCGAVDANGGVIIMNGGTIRNCYSATHSGAIHIHDSRRSHFTFNRGIIENCVATTQGGAIYCENAMEFKSGIIRNCNTDGEGGAIYMAAGELMLEQGSEITNCEGKTGGAIYIKDGTVTLESDSRIDNCRAFGQGGAIYQIGGILNLKDTTEISNCSAATTGAVYPATASGVTINISGSPKVIDNNNKNIDLTAITDTGAGFNSVINATGLMENAQVGLYITNTSHDDGGEEFGTTALAAANIGLTGFINDINKPFIGWPVEYGKEGAAYWAMTIPVQAKVYRNGELSDISNSSGIFAPDKGSVNTTTVNTETNELAVAYAKVNSAVKTANTDGKHTYLYAKIGDVRITNLIYNRTTGAWKYTPVNGSAMDYVETAGPVTLYYFEDPTDITVHYIEKSGSDLTEIGTASTLTITSSGTNTPEALSGYARLFTSYGTTSTEAEGKHTTDNTLDITRLVNAWDGVHINGGEELLGSANDVYVFMYKNPRTVNVKWILVDNTGDVSVFDTSLHPDTTVNVTDSEWMTASSADVASTPDKIDGNTTYRFRYYALGEDITNISNAVLKDLSAFNLKTSDQGLGLLYSADTETDADGTAYTNIDTIYVVYSEVTTVPVTITKTVDGAMGDTTRDFSFTLAVDGSTDEYDFTKTAVDGTTTTGKIAGNNGSFALKHGESIVIELPPDTDITLTETDADYYTTTVPSSENIGTPTVSGHEVAFRIESSANSASLTINNNLPAVSPTSVTLRYTPYLLMLLFGIAILLIRRRRERD